MTLGRPIVMLAVAAVGGLAGWGIHAAMGTHATHEGGADTAGAGGEAPHPATTITALGRLEPKDGVIRVAGPSASQPVIAQLLVDKGDTVRSGQPLAVLDSFELLKAALARLQVELDQAQSEYRRYERLYRDKVVALSERDAWRIKADTLAADLHRAQVELDQATVRAPVSGQVLDIHARAGERIGPEGIAELGQTDQMYAIAEVYETDIGRLRIGQRATITSPALPKPLHGGVERIGLKIGKKDVLGTDPAADTDARVVEVEIRLDDLQGGAAWTNLQVEVAVAP
jgi:HlyD family secretion protein